MRLLVRHNIEKPLLLPINYHHMLQAIIYRNLNPSYGYSNYIHNMGFFNGSRNFKMFTFSLLQGKYEIRGKTIVFLQEVMFEVSSPDLFMIRMLTENISENGIYYGKRHFSQVELYLSDETIEHESVRIKMLSPICVYSTDPVKGKTHFYNPEELKFAQLVCDNFVRKYQACYGIMPDSGIHIEPCEVTERDKYVTKYKNFYINGWMGEYRLYGKRKYLDFLYQAGLGSKNSQGFGMPELVR